VKRWGREEIPISINNNKKIEIHGPEKKVVLGEKKYSSSRRDAPKTPALGGGGVREGTGGRLSPYRPPPLNCRARKRKSKSPPRYDLLSQKRGARRLKRTSRPAREWGLPERKDLLLVREKGL